ncbi:MAG TPA: helix-turn-helix transcriptional regulator [Leptolyngbyaceae cyanobacterium M33_DOE_097]|uniref:Transcriptional regulator n=1 Tax=Oscillatoriales cyanobacterium SpSt-418 TaxID=2282169 RepID=A0A7C3PQ09_9CYAN|nr:helix-turn-helix transcriptional regulator [Leptolyngbyaceae cyanobacterium M33_DOE_097]
MTDESADGTVFVQTTLSVLGGKWKLLILWHLKDGEKRYSELKRLIPGISEKMLIQQLRELEKDAIIDRKTLSEMPPKVEYGFTDYGKTLIPVLQPLCDWGQVHLQRLNGNNTK